MRNDIQSVLATEEQIAEMVSGLGGKISKDYEGKNPLLVCILKGSGVFMSDLIRKITIPIEIEFMCVSSYGLSAETSGKVKIIKDLDTNIHGRDVIIVEDILDTGVTLFRLLGALGERNPKSLEVCVLLNKPSRRKESIDLKYKGMDIPDEFVVGYGLDYAEKYRNLPEICVLKPQIYGGSAADY